MPATIAAVAGAFHKFAAVGFARLRLRLARHFYPLPMLARSGSPCPALAHDYLKAWIGARKDTGAGWAGP
jgi:hypothetical protein